VGGSRMRTIAVIGLVGAVLGLAGCGGETGTSSSSSAAQAEGPRPAVGRAEAGSAADKAAPPVASPGSPSGGGSGAGSGAQAGVSIVRTADVVVEVDDLKVAAARVRAAAQTGGGTVSSETTSLPGTGTQVTNDGAQGEGTATGPDGKRAVVPGESVIVVRVPVAALDATVERVVGVGRELSRTSSAQDVTADLADVGSRVKTQQASVERVRALLAKASSLSDVVLLESELSRREADLEALEARRAALADRAALSTLTVTLRTPGTSPAADDDSGFVGGLRRAGRAVTGSTVVILVILGALLPVAVLTVVIGLPLSRIVRRRRAARPRPPATDAPFWPGPTWQMPPPSATPTAQPPAAPTPAPAPAADPIPQPGPETP